MKKDKENFNTIFFKWYQEFFYNKTNTAKAEFKKTLFCSVFPTLNKAQANSRFENYRRNKPTTINYLTAKEFVTIIKKYDENFEADLSSIFNIKQNEKK